MVFLSLPNRDYLQNGFDAEPTQDPWSSWWRTYYDPANPLLRGDQGWGEGLDQYDRLVKNVYEVQSPLNLLTAHEEMTGHAYLTADRTVERVTFANDVSIVINRGDGEYDHDGTLLPKLGFLASGPTFLAFYARRHDGVEYPDGALFVARSLDGERIDTSREVRVYHGFGEPEIRIGGRLFRVTREDVVDVRGNGLPGPTLA